VSGVRRARSAGGTGRKGGRAGPGARAAGEWAARAHWRESGGPRRASLRLPALNTLGIRPPQRQRGRRLGPGPLIDSLGEGGRATYLAGVGVSRASSHACSADNRRGRQPPQPSRPERKEERKKDGIASGPVRCERPRRGWGWRPPPSAGHEGTAFSQSSPGRGRRWACPPATWHLRRRASWWPCPACRRTRRRPWSQKPRQRWR
jgi:hypothetical protein